MRPSLRRRAAPMRAPRPRVWRVWRVWRGAVAAGLAVLAAACAQWPVEPAPAVVPMAAWGGTPAALPAGVPPQPVRALTVHHQGERWVPGSDAAAYLRRLQAWSRNARGWLDLPYHYIISDDGRIYAGRPEASAGDTNTEYDPRGHLLVMLVGNFEEQQPTAAQLQSAIELLAALARRHGLGAEAIGSHLDFSRQTVCPGAALQARMPEIRAEVARRLRRQAP